MATNTLSCASARNNGRVPICARRITTTVLPSPCSKIKKQWAQCENSEEAAYLSVRTTTQTNSELIRYALQLACGEHRENSAPRDGHFRRLKSGRHSPTIWQQRRRMLKSTSGWSDTWGESKPEYQGTDDYGFTAQRARPANGTRSRLSVRKGHGGRPTPFLTIHCRLPTPVWMPPTRFFRPAVHGQGDGCSIRCLKD